MGRSTESQPPGRRTGDCSPIHDGPNVALAMDRTGKHVMGRLPIGEAPTNIRERYEHALDNCCDSVRSLGTWIGHVLHHGRLGPHSSRSGSRGSCRPPDPGAKSPTVTPKGTKSRHLRLLSKRLPRLGRASCTKKRCGSGRLPRGRLALVTVRSIGAQPAQGHGDRMRIQEGDRR
jgi:hypothetical protein